jgi:hypothetical protein
VRVSEQSIGEEIANSVSHGVGFLAVLTVTPFLVLRAMLAGLPEDWARPNEGPDTWSPFDVVDLNLRARHLQLAGEHPDFGVVTATRSSG